MKVREETTNTRHAKSSLTDYMRLLWRKRFYIIIPLVLTGLISIIGVRMLKPVYMSTALIRMEDENFLSEDVSEFVRVDERRIAIDEETLAKITAEIQSSVFLDQLIDHLGIAENPQLVAAAEAERKSEFPYMTIDEVLYRRLRSMLGAKIEVSLAGPGIFRIACTDVSPEVCFVLADAATTQFLDAQRRRKLAGLQQASEFSEEQLQVYKERLEDSERRLEELQNRITQLALKGNPVGETNLEYIDEFGGEGNLRHAETLKEQLDHRVSDLLTIVEKTQDRLTRLLGSVPDHHEIANDPEVLRMRGNLKRLRETDLRLELGSQGVSGEDLRDNEGQIRRAETRLQRRLSELIGTYLSDVSIDYRPLVVEYFLQLAIYESVVAERDRLDSFIAAFKTNLNQTPQLEMELTKLQDEVSTNRDIYNTFLRAKTSAQISEAAQSTNIGASIEILEKPSRPALPFKPNRRNIILVSLLFGLMLGVGGIIVSEYADASFRTVEEIEAELGVKVLGAIPNVNPKSTWNREDSRRRLIIWASTVVIVVLVGIVGFVMYGKMAEKQAIEIYGVESVDE
jgi:uncharacterized protein involved in exopolysaccharide biosynthesis